ncbi:MAG: hypothetical protein ACR2GD_11975 [Pyrinomonadaceae bacterium]
MKISQAGILFLITITVLASAGCGRIIARKDLVDGAKAYKDRKFDQAEALFRDAVQRDPSNDTAQLFLARTLHSEYAANRTDTAKAEQAITEYKKTIDEYKKAVTANASQLSGDRTPCSYSDYEVSKLQGNKRAALQAFKTLSDSLKAVANLLDNLQKEDERVQWLTQWGDDTSLPDCLRAEAYNSLAAKENTCANDITESPDVKKTVQKDGKAAFVFSKPPKPEDYETLKRCVQQGTDYIDKALAKDQTSDSIWSYKTSLLIQAMRLAEMEGRTADKDALKAQADEAKAKFSELAKSRKEKSDAEDAQQKAEQEATDSKK